MSRHKNKKGRKAQNAVGRNSTNGTSSSTALSECASAVDIPSALEDSSTPASNTATQTPAEPKNDLKIQPSENSVIPQGKKGKKKRKRGKPGNQILASQVIIEAKSKQSSVVFPPNTHELSEVKQYGANTIDEMGSIKSSQVPTPEAEGELDLSETSKPLTLSDDVYAKGLDAKFTANSVEESIENNKLADEQSQDFFNALNEADEALDFQKGEPAMDSMTLFLVAAEAYPEDDDQRVKDNIVWTEENSGLNLDFQHLQASNEGETSSKVSGLALTDLVSAKLSFDPLVAIYDQATDVNAELGIQQSEAVQEKLADFVETANSIKPPEYVTSSHQPSTSTSFDPLVLYTAATASSDLQPVGYIPGFNPLEADVISNFSMGDKKINHPSSSTVDLPKLPEKDIKSHQEVNIEPLKVESPARKEFIKNPRISASANQFISDMGDSMAAMVVASNFYNTAPVIAPRLDAPIKKQGSTTERRHSISVPTQEEINAIKDETLPPQLTMDLNQTSRTLVGPSVAAFFFSANAIHLDPIPYNQDFQSPKYSADKERKASSLDQNMASATTDKFVSESAATINRTEVTGSDKAPHISRAEENSSSAKKSMFHLPQIPTGPILSDVQSERLLGAAELKAAESSSKTSLAKSMFSFRSGKSQTTKKLIDFFATTSEPADVPPAEGAANAELAQSSIASLQGKKTKPKKHFCFCF